MAHATPSKTTAPLLYINVAAGSLVVGIGFWLIWREWLVLTVVLLGVAVFLALVGRSLARVWAWATLLVGVESLSWPIVTMIRARLASADPSEQQMVEMLNALLFGLFFAIFWLSFSYGIFSWARRHELASGGADTTGGAARPTAGKR